MSRLAPWWLSLTTLCAAAALSRLLGIWCADPALGMILTGSAAAAGIVLQSRTSRPDGNEAVAWASGAGLLVAFLPILLRFLGLNTASAVFLEEPLSSAVFVLGQVWLTAALAAAAAARAARGLARPATIPERFIPLLLALAAAAGSSRLDPAILLAGAGAALAFASALAACPRAGWRQRPLRTQAYVLSATIALGLASRSPGLMRDVWTARLDTIYPGGRFLSLSDDGVRVRGVYEFPTKVRAALRDGVLQGDDISSKASVLALRGQKSLMNSVLLVAPPTPAAPIAAAALGLKVALEEGSRIEADVLDTLDAGNWRRTLQAPSSGERPEGLVLFLPRPLGFMQARRLAGASALRSLRSRLTEDACAAIVVPTGASPALIARVESSAREAFGVTRTADTGRAVLVAACPASVETAASVLYARIPFDLQKMSPGGDAALAEGLRWRPAPTTK